MKKRLTSLLLTLCMTATLFSSFTLPAHAMSGAGTADNPYLISSAADLMNFAAAVNGGQTTVCARLTADINMSGVSSFTPIGNTEARAYRGTFDGDRHTIYNLTINVNSTDSIGLFGFIGGGTVKSVALANASFTNNYAVTEITTSTVRVPEGYAVGSRGTGSKNSSTIIATASYTVEGGSGHTLNCYLSPGYSGGSSSGNAQSTHTYTTIKTLNPTVWNTMNDARDVPYNSGFTDAGARNVCGGIAGTLKSGEITLSSFGGTLKANYGNVGGLVGRMDGGTVSKCYTTGSYTGTLAAGGVAALNGGSVTDCYSTASCNRYTYTATIYSTAPSTTAATQAWTGQIALAGPRTVTVTTYNYGLSGGSAATQTIHQGYNYGFAGTVGSSATITNSYYYNASSNLAFSDNASRGTNTYILSSSSSGATPLTSSEFAQQYSFNDWDFGQVWVISSSLNRPVLYNMAGAESIDKPWAIYPTGDDAIIKITADNPDTALIDLSKYVSLSNGQSTNDRFKYYITTGREYASISEEDNDYLIVAAGLPKNDYTVKLMGYDLDEKCDPFEFTLTIRAMTRVGVPEAVNGSFPYSRSTLLAMIPLTEGWKWDNEMLVPRNDTTKYDAYYPYSTDAKFYDISAVTAAAKASGTNVYDVTEYKDDSGTVAGIKAKLTLPVLDSAESQKPVTFHVTDGDSAGPLKGVYISTEYEDEFIREGGHTTGEDGVLKADLTPGMRKITAKASGYEAWEDTREIRNALTGTDVYIEMYPTRYSFTAPAVYEKDADGKVGEKIANAKVTITKVDGVPVHAWNGDNVSLTVDAESEALLADGIYAVRSATYGYTTDDVTYVKIDRAAAEGEREKYYKYYSSDLEQEKTETTLYAVAMTEPVYNIKINKDSDSLDDINYTVTVKLSNIKATMGTFGLRWDSDKFELRDGEDSVKLGEGINIFRMPEDYSGSEWDGGKGYYVFNWITDENTELNAENEPADVVTFEFQLTDKEYMDKITADTFGIKPWTETDDAINYAREQKALGYDPKLWEFWREVDEDNKANKLKYGRIEATKAVVNDIDTGGFFQAAVNSDPDNETDPSKFYDVMCQLEYGFKVNSVIVFHTIDSISGEDIEKARVRLFDDDVTLFGSDFTNTNGRVSFSVDSDTASVIPFTYDVQLKGYWPVPESGLTQDRPPAEARAYKATEVTARLEQKIYHVPLIKPNNVTEPVQTVELVGDADLGGEKYAYNNRDFHFRIKGAKGYRIKQYPTKADIYVNGELIKQDLEPDENCLFTLDKSYLDHSVNDNLRALTESELQTLKTADATKDDYADWSGAQPDEDGYRGYNIEIKFDHFDVVEIEYIVEGMTNGTAKGTVTYDPDVLPEGTPAGNTAVNPVQTKNGDVVLDYDADHPENVYNKEGTFDYIKLQTLRTKKEGETITQRTNHQTGTFTFTAASGYWVQKVYINGLEIDTYEDLKSFTYSFGEVDMDNSIIVLFGNEDDPAEDTVMTLIVGDFGYVDTTTPAEEKDIMLTKRVYLNPTEDLVFETHAMDGYELYKVELEKDGAKRTDITRKGVEVEHEDYEGSTLYTKYTVSKPAGDERNITVYVTFKNTLAEITPNLFVRSYVDYGKGEIIPTGILIYNMYDTVELDIKADKANSWLVKSVKVSPYYDLDSAKEYEYETLKTEQTYKWETLEEDMAFGAVFVERAYELEGFVDLDQGAGPGISTANILSGAKVTFVRIDGENGEEFTKQPLYYTTSSALRTSAPFSIELPAGWWNVYITKPGYLNYKITNFHMEVPAVTSEETGEYAVTKFGEKDASVKHIIPYIGSTTDGEYISLTDAANIKSGWRDNVNKTVRAMADVDNNGTVAIEDLNYVMFNFNKHFVTKTYEEFINGVSETETYVKN